MARIIVFEKEMKTKFYKWVAQYVRAINGDIKKFAAEELIAFLVEENIFTLESLRKELNNAHIALHEKHFQKAKLLMKNER